MTSSMVCHCLKIPYDEIEKVIRQSPDLSLDDLIEKSGAGTRCGACISPSSRGTRKFYLEEILAKFPNQVELLAKDQDAGQDKVVVLAFEARKGEMEKGQKNPFSTLSLYQKIVLLEEIMEATIRPLLKKDGGDCEIVDVGDQEILLEFKGACVGCSSSGAGTLEFVRQTLAKKLAVKDFMVHRQVSP